MDTEQERGSGGFYDALDAGSIDQDDLGSALAQTPIPTILAPNIKPGFVLAADVPNWRRPAAGTNPQIVFPPLYSREGQGEYEPRLDVILQNGR